MNHQKTLLAVAFLASAATTGTAQAALVDRGNGLLYDNVLNLTWLQDANYAKTWDFKLQSSQQLKIVVKVNSFNKPGETPASGCVAIMFGFKIKK